MVAFGPLLGACVESKKDPPRASAVQTTLGSHSERTRTTSSKLLSQDSVDPTTVLFSRALNGQTDAWTINYGFTVTDSFKLPFDSASSVSQVTFYAWVFPGDTLDSVDYSFDSTDGEPQVSVQTAQGAALSQSLLGTNDDGFDVLKVTFYPPDLGGWSPDPGSYSITLENVVSVQGNPVFWDQGPDGFDYPRPTDEGASENEIGFIYPQSFFLAGTTVTGSFPLEMVKDCFSELIDAVGIAAACPESVESGKASYDCLRAITSKLGSQIAKKATGYAAAVECVVKAGAKSATWALPIITDTSNANPLPAGTTSCPGVFRDIRESVCNDISYWKGKDVDCTKLCRAAYDVGSGASDVCVGDCATMCADMTPRQVTGIGGDVPVWKSTWGILRAHCADRYGSDGKFKG
jgi:hypothetical protein